jgi:hypothetical protein
MCVVCVYMCMYVLDVIRSPRYKKAPPSGSAVGKSISIVWQACTRTLTHRRQNKQYNGQHVALSQYDDLHHSNHYSSSSTVTHWLDRYYTQRFPTVIQTPL